MFGHRHKLSMQDVERLLAQPTPQNKIETAAKILAEAEQISDDPVEFALASEIIARLARDVEVSVRQAISWQIAHSPMLTPALARQMAHDIGPVAFPILRYADLADDLLIQALGRRDPAKTLAVAGRKALSSDVANAVVDTGNIKAIIVLMGNSTAKISDQTLRRVVKDYGLVMPVSNAVAQRAGLAADIVDAVLVHVSHRMRERLISTYNLSTEHVDRLLAAGAEQALVTIIEPLETADIDVTRFLARLQSENRLTPSFLLRCLCAGDIRLFRTALSVRGSLPLLAIDELLRDRGPLGLPALLRRCDIPLSLLPAFKSALHVWRDSGFGSGEVERSAYQASVLASIYEDCTPIDDAELDQALQDIHDPLASLNAA